MGVILQVALPSRVLAAARLQCGAAGAGASRGLGVCAEHARLAARGESARAMEIGDFLVWLGPVANSQCDFLHPLTTESPTRHYCPYFLPPTHNPVPYDTLLSNTVKQFSTSSRRTPSRIFSPMESV